MVAKVLDGDDEDTQGQILRAKLDAHSVAFVLRFVDFLNMCPQVTRYSRCITAFIAMMWFLPRVSF